MADTNNLNTVYGILNTAMLHLSFNPCDVRDEVSQLLLTPYRALNELADSIAPNAEDLADASTELDALAHVTADHAAGALRGIASWFQSHAVDVYGLADDCSDIRTYGKPRDDSWKILESLSVKTKMEAFHDLLHSATVYLSFNPCDVLAAASLTIIKPYRALNDLGYSLIPTSEDFRSASTEPDALVNAIEYHAARIFWQLAHWIQWEAIDVMGLADGCYNIMEYGEPRTYSYFR